MKKILIIIAIVVNSIFSFADTEDFSVWLHYDISSPVLESEESSYSGENSWGISFEYYCPSEDIMKFGIGVKYQSEYELDKNSDFNVYATPKTYTFTPVYLIADYFFTDYTYFTFQAGIGEVKASSGFEDEFGELDSNGFYIGAGVGFEYIEFIYSIDCLKTVDGENMSVSRLAVRI